ncbi:MAG: metallophosphoesterase family protein [Paracoccaceae bacterium]|nr:metallophosphoesterase family protein [Paracoccaceae bacterium]
MRVAVISDIHSNRAALEAVLAVCDRLGIGDIANLGDSLSGPFDPAGTADILIERAIPSIMGNHDRMLLAPPEKLGLWERWAMPELTPAHLDWVRNLPETLDWKGLFLTHAAPGDDAENWLDFRGPGRRLIARDRSGVEARGAGLTAAVTLTGHTHTPRMVRLTGGRMVVNPGAVGCPAYFDDRTDPPFIHETGAPDARFAVLEEVGGKIEVSLRTVPYDPAGMQALARARGADTWAEAIGSGWFTSASQS